METQTVEQVNNEQAVPTQEEVAKQLSCEHCKSKLISKAELTGAVQFIHATLNTFRDRVKKLTGVQSKKVLEAIIESPLEKEVNSFTTQEAVKCFELGIAINSAKYVLFQGSQNCYDEIAEDVEKQMSANEENGTASEQVNSVPQNTQSESMPLLGCKNHSRVNCLDCNGEGTKNG